MKEKKRRALKIFMVAQVTIVGLYYLFGSFGLQALKAADRGNLQLLEELKSLEAELAALEQELQERTDNPFYKETIARKELQMAYEDEIIYMLPKKDR